MKKKIYSLLVIFILLSSTPSYAIYTDSHSSQGMEYANLLETQFKNRANSSTGSDSSSRKAFIDWIKEVLASSPLEAPSIKEQHFHNFYTDFGEKYSGTNLLVTIPGKSNKKQIVVGAHYDGTGYGDNGSGVAFLLTLIEALATETLPYDVQFVFFDAEEVGLVGSQYYVKKMSFFEKNKTLMMINIDSIAFGDYPTIYGGIYNTKKNIVEQTEGYDLAVRIAQEHGINVYTTQDLDGYYAKHQAGPARKEMTLYSNPWTQKNPSPNNEEGHQLYVSPSTGLWGDHANFADKGIPYLYLEATNWFAYDPENKSQGFDGYFDTNFTEAGDKGRFMNTEHDTLENMNTYFPNRLKQHFQVYGLLMTHLLLNPDDTFERKINWAEELLLPVILSVLFLLLCFLIYRKILKRDRKKR